jgi:hypothetical protein
VSMPKPDEYVAATDYMRDNYPTPFAFRDNRDKIYVCMFSKPRPMRGIENYFMYYSIEITKSENITFNQIASTHIYKGLYHGQMEKINLAFLSKGDLSQKIIKKIFRKINWDIWD